MKCKIKNIFVLSPAKSRVAPVKYEFAIFVRKNIIGSDYTRWKRF